MKHVRGTAEHGITSLVYSEPTYENGRRGPGRSAGRTAVTVAGLAPSQHNGPAIQRALSAWESHRLIAPSAAADLRSHVPRAASTGLLRTGRVAHLWPGLRACKALLGVRPSTCEGAGGQVAGGEGDAPLRARALARSSVWLPGWLPRWARLCTALNTRVATHTTPCHGHVPRVRRILARRSGIRAAGGFDHLVAVLRAGNRIVTADSPRAPSDGTNPFSCGSPTGDTSIRRHQDAGLGITTSVSHASAGLVRQIRRGHASMCIPTRNAAPNRLGVGRREVPRRSRSPGSRSASTSFAPFGTGASVVFNVRFGPKHLVLMDRILPHRSIGSLNDDSLIR